MHLESQFTKLFGSAALPALDEIFFDAIEQAEDPRPLLFNMESTDREIVQKQSIASLGTFSSVNEGELAPSDNFNQMYSKTYTIVKYAKRIGISDEMIADDRFDLISKMVRALARSARETQLLSALNVFNNGFSSVLSSDGAALFSNAHPTLVGNQSNILSSAADLAYASLAIAEQMFRSFQDDRGKKLLIKPSVLLVSESDRHNALEIVQSPYKAGTANNNINALGVDGGLKVVSSPYLTDADAWFLLGQPDDTGLRIIDRSGLMTKTHEDVLAGTLYYKAEYRQAVGADEWRGVIATPGAG